MTDERQARSTQSELWFSCVQMGPATENNDLAHLTEAKQPPSGSGPGHSEVTGDGTVEYHQQYQDFVGPTQMHRDFVYDHREHPRMQGISRKRLTSAYPWYECTGHSGPGHSEVNC
jgi:hypothetical protein